MINKRINTYVICNSASKTNILFFPTSLLKNWIVDIKTPFEQKILELIRKIEDYADTKLTLDLLRLLQNHFEEDFEAAERGYPIEEDIDNE